MKIGLSVLLGTFVLSAGFAQTAAQAVTLPSKPHAERVLRHVNLPHEKTVIRGKFTKHTSTRTSKCTNKRIGISTRKSTRWGARSLSPLLARAARA